MKEEKQDRDASGDNTDAVQGKQREQTGKPSGEWTDEALNDAIGKACYGPRYHKPTEEEFASGSYYQYAPEFVRDLNACHEMEGMIRSRTIGRYCENLVRLCKGSATEAMHADARTRCLAFVKTLGLTPPQ